MNIILGASIIIGFVVFILNVFKDIGINMIFNAEALLIVAGGTTFALLIGFPIKKIRFAISEVISSFSEKRGKEEVIRELLEFSRKYRRSDIRSIENHIKEYKDGFLRMGMNLLISHYSPREIRNIMEREMMLRIINFNFSQNILKTTSRLTPSFGLAGTVISLIGMFRNLESVDAIAPMMAVALMSTFYGVVIANLFMLPLCAKLKDRAIEAEAVMNLTIEGMLAISRSEHPLKIEERLRGYREIEDVSFQNFSAPVAVPNEAGIS